MRNGPPVKREANQEENDNQNFAQFFSPSEDEGSDDSTMSLVSTTDENFMVRRSKRKKRNSTDLNRSSQSERQVRRRYRKSLIENFTELRESDVMTDCEIKVPGKPGIRVHRLVLAAASPYFRALLQSQMQEAISGEIIMKDVSFETVELLVAFAYGQEFCITKKNAQEIIQAADCYQFDILKNHCEQFLSAEIDEQNCFGFLQLADHLRLSRLRERSLKYALENFEKVIQGEEYLQLPVRLVVSFLKDNRLVAKREEQVYNAAVKWLEFSVDERKQDSSQVLDAVRLGRLATRFLIEEVEKNELFTDELSKSYINRAKTFKMLPFEEQKQGYFPCGQPRQCSGISEILVVVGGICMNRRLKEVDYYSKEKGWQSLADISTHHSNMHSYSVIAHNNDIYITGGHSNTQCTVDHVSVYQSKYNKWLELPPMRHPRERHGSACVDGSIYVVGGLMAGKSKRKPAVLQAVERFDPQFQRWEDVKPLPKRCYSPGVVNYKNKLYVIGGVSMSDDASSSSSKIVLPLVQV